MRWLSVLWWLLLLHGPIVYAECESPLNVSSGHIIMCYIRFVIKLTVRYGLCFVFGFSQRFFLSLVHSRFYLFATFIFHFFSNNVVCIDAAQNVMRWVVARIKTECKKYEQMRHHSVLLCHSGVFFFNSVRSYHT